MLTILRKILQCVRYLDSCAHENSRFASSCIHELTFPTTVQLLLNTAVILGRILKSAHLSQMGTETLAKNLSIVDCLLI